MGWEHRNSPKALHNCVSVKLVSGFNSWLQDYTGQELFVWFVIFPTSQWWSEAKL